MMNGHILHDLSLRLRQCKKADCKCAKPHTVVELQMRLEERFLRSGLPLMCFAYHRDAQEALRRALYTPQHLKPVPRCIQMALCTRIQTPQACAAHLTPELVEQLRHPLCDAEKTAMRWMNGQDADLRACVHWKSPPEWDDLPLLVGEALRVLLDRGVLHHPDFIDERLLEKLRACNPNRTAIQLQQIRELSKSQPHAAAHMMQRVVKKKKKSKKKKPSSPLQEWSLSAPEVPLARDPQRSLPPPPPIGTPVKPQHHLCAHSLKPWLASLSETYRAACAEVLDGLDSPTLLCQSQDVLRQLLQYATVVQLSAEDCSKVASSLYMHLRSGCAHDTTVRRASGRSARPPILSTRPYLEDSQID